LIRFDEAKPPAVANKLVANKPSAVVVANKARSGDRHKATDERRAYMADLMRKRRAAKKPA
jgi:hypothetical protein